VAVALLVLPAPLLFTKELDLLELLVLPAPELFACEFKVFKLLLFPTILFKVSDESKEGIVIYLLFLLAIKTKSTCVNTDTANFQ
jgi:hypothetical protein